MLRLSLRPPLRLWVSLALLLLTATAAVAGEPPAATPTATPLEQHAEAGDAMAQYALAEQIMLSSSPDFAAAAHWYRAAAKQGHSAAQIRLGQLHARGQGVTRDVVLAYHYFDLASRFNSDAAQYKVMLARNMSLAQIQEAEQLTSARRAGEAEVVARYEERVAAAHRPAPEVTPPPLEVGFSAQVGSFTDRTNAEALATSLTEEGFPVQRQESAVGGRYIVRLRVGPYATMEEARHSQTELKRRLGLPSWIVPPGY